MFRLAGSGLVCVLSVILTGACGSNDVADADIGADAGAEDTGSDAADIRAEETSGNDTADRDITPDTVSDVADDTSDDAGAPDTESDAPDEVDVPGFPACTETPCPDGYECFTEGCLPVVAAGGDCGADGLICERGTGCVTRADRSVCLRDGTEGGYCRVGAGASGFDCAVEPVCDAGLACDLSLNSRGSCVPGLPVGALCGAWRDLCAEDADCVLVLGTRRCVADGDAGGQCVVGLEPDGDDLPACDEGLSCSEGFDGCMRQNDLCLQEVATDASCAGDHDLCPGEQKCVTLTTGAICRSPGQNGAACRASGDACDAGLVCGSTLLGSAVCMEEAQVGESCGVAGNFVTCAAGLGCTSEHVSDAGICLAQGTGAGADCRAEEPRCDGDLLCSDFSRYRQTCRIQAAAGDPCDLSGIQVLCPSNTQCMPSSYGSTWQADATCVPAQSEVEPNPVATPTTDATPSMVVFDAALSDDSVDCFSVLFGNDQALFIEMSQVTTLFTASSLVQLWNSAGEELGRWTTSPSPTLGPLSQAFRLEPNVIPLLRTLTPDTYTVCVVPATGVVGNYRIGLSAAEFLD